MADWRNRGFVPDSDEEDESAISITSEGRCPIQDDAWNGLRDPILRDVVGGAANISEGKDEGEEADNEEDLQRSKRNRTPKFLLGRSESNIRATEDVDMVHIFDNSPNASRSFQSRLASARSFGQAIARYPLSQISADPGAQLEQELFGFQKVKRSTNPLETVRHSVLPSPETSSPLSSPPSSISNAFWLESNSEGQQKVAASDVRSTFAGVFISSNSDTHAYPVVEEQEPRIDNTGKAGRALRSRRPIQLHPYVVEGERYRKTLKDRGLRPVRLTQAQDEGARAFEHEDDSQDWDYEGDDESQAMLSNHQYEHIDRPQTQSLGDRELQQGPTRPSQNSLEERSDFVGGDQDDLPDVAALLQNGSTLRSQSNKRRKLAHVYTGTKDQQENRLLGDDDVLRSQQGHDEISIRSQPSSSPLVIAGSKPRSQLNFGFRNPFGPSIETCTPQVDDRKSASPAPVILIQSSSEDNVQVHRRAASSRVVSESSSSALSESEDSEKLHIVSKRIRGVLPASWLRLDQHRQQRPRKSHTPAKDGTRASARKALPRPGVAQRIEPSGRLLFRKDEELDGLRSSDCSSDGGAPHVALEPSDSQDDFNLDDDQAFRIHDSQEDVWEDNRIDEMLPSKSRSRKAPPTLSRKRQLRLTDFRVRPPKSPKTVENSIPQRKKTHFQPRNTEHARVLPKRKQRRAKDVKPQALRLSVLDVLARDERETSRIPDFLKIAARQAKARKDQGRHSPTKKTLKLARREDTEEVLSVLQHWRQGLIGPSRTRQPLMERHHNIQAEVVNVPSRSRATKLRTSSGSTLNQAARHDQEHAASRSNRAVVGTDIVKPSSGVRVRRPKGAITQRPLGPRSAQLESLESEAAGKKPSELFRQNLFDIDQLYERQLGIASLGQKPQLFRFLHSECHDLSPNARNHTRTPGDEGLCSTGKDATSQIRPRKQVPRRLDIQAIQYRQPLEPVIVDVAAVELATPESRDQSVLQGLGHYGTHYTVDFGIVPMQAGTYFHESTFIGSGEFSKALRATSQVGETTRGNSIFSLGSRTFRWSVWNSTVSSELNIGFRWLEEHLNRAQDPGLLLHQRLIVFPELKSLLRFVIRYLASGVRFSNPVDRVALVQQLLGSLSTLLERTNESLAIESSIEQNPEVRVGIARDIQTFGVVLAYQARVISQHDVVDAVSKAQAQTLLERFTQALVKRLIREGLANLREFYEDQHHHAKRDAGIKDQYPFVQDWVVAIHVSERVRSLGIAFWDAFNSEVAPANLENIPDAHALDSVWQKMFTIIPLVEFNEFGALEIGSRFRRPFDNWKLVTRLVNVVLRIYLADSRGQKATFNSYCRSLLTRCHHLIKSWGWRRSDTIVGTLFDFFASRGLAHLRNEESFGTPQFLDTLNIEEFSLVEPNDRTYHVFLKIVGMSLIGMRGVYADRKIRNIAFRLMPNHGRQYHKEKGVRQEDLDALRHHHYLLCTIYWASPASSRPSLGGLRDLVDHETSHREACHINIRAWYILAKFQLSTHESHSTLEPFAAWYDEIVTQALRQHHAARSEAQLYARVDPNLDGQSSFVESVVKNNQQQVEAVMNDALTSMRNALRSTEDPLHAIAILSASSINGVFRLYDAKKPSVNQLVLLALEILEHICRLCQLKAGGGISQPTSEESQEYGDWTEIENNEKAEVNRNIVEQLQGKTYEPLSKLMSNAFGDDQVPEEVLLLKMIDCDINLTRLLVRQDIMKWSQKVENYTHGSWSRLRKTEQTRKFTPYLMSQVLEKDPDACQENTQTFLQIWMRCLVDRDSRLSYHHNFTSMLLKYDFENPLLQRLRSAIPKGHNSFSIDAEGFREGRLNLIKGGFNFASCRIALTFDSPFDKHERYCC